MVAVASDETVDRHGESLPIDSWDLINFKKNPVLLWAHDYSVPPIGVATKIKVENNRLIFTPEFHTITQLSREIKAMFESDPPIMNSFSVGFIPHYEKATDKNGNKVPLELLEISAVPVPANPNARVMEKSVASFTVEEKDAVGAWLKSTEEKAGDDSKATAMEIQTLICSKDVFDTEEKAHAWILDHGFRADKVDDTDDSFRYRQIEPSECQEDSFRTIDIDKGVSAVICRTEKSICTCNEKIIPMLDEYAKRLSAAIRDIELKNKSTAAAQVASGQNRAEKVEAKRRNTRDIVVRILRDMDKEIGLALKRVNKMD
jgi:hypothetical protein